MNRAFAASAPWTCASRRQTEFTATSRVLDEGVHDLLVAGDVEMDRELVVFDRGDRAVAEFLVKHPFADGKAAYPGQFLAAPRHRGRIGQPRIGQQRAAWSGSGPPRRSRR